MVVDRGRLEDGPRDFLITKLVAAFLATTDRDEISGAESGGKMGGMIERPTNKSFGFWLIVHGDGD